VNVPFQKWFYHTEAGKQFWQQVDAHSASQKDPKAYNALINGKRMLSFTDQPLEPITVNLIKQLQNRGIKVIALTHFNTGSLGGPLGLIPSLPVWRWNKLKEIDIDFSSSFPEQQELIFSQFTSKSGRHPIFYKGILLCLAPSLIQSIGNPKKLFFLMILAIGLNQYRKK
jgi:Protein of unknown function (DUF2608)